MIGSSWLFKEQWNFSEIPTEMVFSTYMKALLICANGDGILTDEERNWVIGYCAALGAPNSVIEQLKIYEANEDINEIISNCKIVNIEGSKRSLIYDAVRASTADGEYHPNEKAVVRKMAEKLGISEEVVNQIEEIYAEEVRIREKRINLIFPDGTPL